MKSLAVKYRPKNWKDVVEQESTKKILQSQIKTGTFKHAYLFTGPAGCGKTTCARIFAREINKGQGQPVEMDAASNSGVDDVRDIISQAKKKSLDSEYKVFIIDECHSISNTGWQAFLKLIEEPPAKSIFIFCTTDSQKIPKTILSRVQRYDFRRMSQDGIIYRLNQILANENMAGENDAIEYIAKLADGGMRDAITMMDKCLSYSSTLTISTVVKALGVTDYSTMIQLTDGVLDKNPSGVIEIIENIRAEGKDLKQFVQGYLMFLLDVQKYFLTNDFSLIQIPNIPEYADWLNDTVSTEDRVDRCLDVLKVVLQLSRDIRFSSSPKYDIEAVLLLLCVGEYGTVVGM